MYAGYVACKHQLLSYATGHLVRSPLSAIFQGSALVYTDTKEPRKHDDVSKHGNKNMCDSTEASVAEVDCWASQYYITKAQRKSCGKQE